MDHLAVDLAGGRLFVAALGNNSIEEVDIRGGRWVARIQGLREPQAERPVSPAASAWRPLIFVTASLVLFGLSIERLGLVVSILLLIGIGAVATRGLRLGETIAAAFVLIVLS